MTITATGSIGLDSIETPFGCRERILGGSAVHFALAAALFAPVRIVGAVGYDFPSAHLDLLRDRGISTDAIERLPDAQSFFWRGHYGSDLADAETIEREANAAARRSTMVPRPALRADVLFLASDDPHFQERVRRQFDDTTAMALDTRELWIRDARDALAAVMTKVDVVFLNEPEASLLDRTNGGTEIAARALLATGPSTVVVKRGAAGALAFTESFRIEVPAYPVAAVDPTGAGDAFAGGFLGHLGSAGVSGLGAAHLLRAMATGAATASLTVEAFGTERIVRAEASELLTRIAQVAERATIQRSHAA